MEVLTLFCAFLLSIIGFAVVMLFLTAIAATPFVITYILVWISTRRDK